MRALSVILTVLFMISTISTAFAGDGPSNQDLLNEINALKARVADLEKKLEDQKCAITTQRETVSEIKESMIQFRPGEGVKVPSCGIEISAGATLVMQGTPNANNAGTAEASRFDASWSSDIFIQKQFGDFGLALIHLEPGEGDTIEPELSLYSNVNRDANNMGAAVPVTELWYEHYFLDGQLTVTAGKLDPGAYIDQNEYAHDECTQFLGRIFKQNPAIEWPDDNTLGSRVVIAPEKLPYLSLEASYFDADNDWDAVFDGPFVSCQLNVKPSKLFGWDENMWDGNYRFYWWLNGRDHAKLAFAGDPSADDTKHVNTGFGLSCDQMLTDVFGVFARFGWQRPELVMVSANPNASPCEASWSGGLQMTGKYWGRENDVLAFGIGQDLPSKEYKDAGNGGAAEGHFEAYYKWQALEYLSISPDFQVIWNPRGVNHDYLGDDDTIFVYGMRAQIDI